MTVDQHDLIFSSDVAFGGGDARALRRALARGRVVRVRRGVYCARDTWDAADGRERHLLRVHAAMRTLQTPAIVAGTSAAALWNIPIRGSWPEEVTLLVPYRGGGKSEPGVRRTSVAARFSPSTVIAGTPVTTLARTAVDLARSADFPGALASVDAVLSREGEEFRHELSSTLERMALRGGRVRASRVIAAATALSGSPGESVARGAMIELGFEVPELQVEFIDSEGPMYPDFFWRSVRKAGEFDGKAKYTRQEYTGGDPGEVVWREKKREDRLRRQVDGVVRILTEHVSNPPALARLLAEAGIPRA